MTAAMKLNEQNQDGTNGADIWHRIAAIQSEYNARVQAASLAGDTALVIQLFQELNAKIVQIQSEMLSQASSSPAAIPSPPKRPSIYDSTLCKISLDDIVYDGDVNG